MKTVNDAIVSLVVLLVAFVGVIDARKFVYRSRVSSNMFTEWMEFGRKMERTTSTPKVTEFQYYLEESIPEWGLSMSYSMSHSMSMSMSYPLPSLSDEILDLGSAYVIDEHTTSPEVTEIDSSSLAYSCATQQDDSLWIEANATFSYSAETITESTEFVPSLEAEILADVAELLNCFVDDSTGRYLKQGGARSLSLISMNTSPGKRSTSETCEPTHEDAEYCTVFDSALTLYVDDDGSQDEAVRNATLAIKQVLERDVLDTASISQLVVKVSLFEATDEDLKTPNVFSAVKSSGPGAESISAGAAVAIGGAIFVFFVTMGLVTVVGLERSSSSSSQDDDSLFSKDTVAASNASNPTTKGRDWNTLGCVGANAETPTNSLRCESQA